MKKMMMLGTLAALVMLMLAAAPAFAANKNHHNDRRDNDRRDNDRDIVFVDNSDFNDHFFCEFPFCDDNDFDHFNDFDFDHFNDFDNFGNEQEVQSGDASQAILVEGGGANSNQCVGIQGVNNTGNAVTNTGIVQGAPINNNGFFDDNGFIHDNDFFDHDGFFHHNDFFPNNGFFDGGEVEVQDSGNFTINPSQTVSCNQQVNQTATAA